jgi:hypothetical protein
MGLVRPGDSAAGIQGPSRDVTAQRDHLICPVELEGSTGIDRDFDEDVGWIGREPVPGDQPLHRLNRQFDHLTSPQAGRDPGLIGAGLLRTDLIEWLAAID